jgi:hypothetical protein
MLFGITFIFFVPGKPMDLPVYIDIGDVKISRNDFHFAGTWIYKDAFKLEK